MSKRKRKAAPAGCYWRGATLWGRAEINGKERRWSLETDDPAVAATRRKAGKDRLIAVMHGDAKWTFEDVYDSWEKDVERRVKERTLARRTADRYLCSLAQLSPWLEGKRLIEVDGKLVATIIRERQDAGVSNATVKRDLVALSSVANFAMDQGWIEVNPVLPRMKRVKEARQTIVLPRRQDIDLVMARAPGMIKNMVAVAMATGARETELLMSERGHIDSGRQQMTLTGKGNKTRTIDLQPFGGYELVQSLTPYVGSPYLFWHSAGQSYRNFASQFSAIVDRTAAWAQQQGIDFNPFRFHDLRHWHAIHFLKEGCGSIYDLQHRLGHASVKTTEGYLRAGYLTHEEQEAVKAGRSAQKPAQRVLSVTGTA